MTTAAQAAANAQFSTGPRTEPGKARSSQNARKHGFTARELVVAPGEREDFESLRESLLAELAPLGVLKVLTFNQLLQAAWNLRRCRRLEADLAVNGPDPSSTNPPPAPNAPTTAPSASSAHCKQTAP